MFTPAFLEAYPLPWRTGDTNSPEVVDCYGSNVIFFQADTPEDREFWENVVNAVNRGEEDRAGVVEAEGLEDIGALVFRAAKHLVFAGPMARASIRFAVDDQWFRATLEMIDESEGRA